MSPETSTSESPAIHHDAGQKRFTATVDGQQAVLEYQREGGFMVITHTVVPEAIGGRGIAGHLVRAALEHAREQKWSVRPSCSYAASWMESHPEYNELLG